MATRNPDRLFPLEPAARSTTRALYERTADHPILSPHGHVPARLLLDDLPFANPTELLITGDHYLGRLLHSFGVGFDQLGLGESATDPREAWRLVASLWPRFAGTATGYWMTDQLAGVFGITTELTSATADEIYDQI